MMYSVEILSRVIMEDAYREADSIIEKAKTESAEIIKKAKKDSNDLKSKSKISLNQTIILNNIAKVISLEELRSKCDILALKEKILERAVRQIQQAFFSLSGSKDYPLMLKRLTMDGLKYLEKEGTEFVCKVNSKDQSLMSNKVLDELKEKTGKWVSLDKEPIDIAGGVIVFRADYRVFYDNSFEAIFERKRENLRCIAAECIFG